MNINNLNYKNNHLTYKETVIARSIENTTKQSREVNTLTPPPQGVREQLTTFESYNFFKLCRRLILNSSFLILNFSKSAFSLIELSIVLIIIGLLVAGVTGGASLIESAKVRALYNEMSGWKQSIMSFYTIKGRLPGDIHNKGGVGPAFGYRDNKLYPAGSFASPYDTDGNINQYGAPFVEMYLEGTSDFKPERKNGTTFYSCIETTCYSCPPYGTINDMNPKSKVLKNIRYMVQSVLSDRDGSTCSKGFLKNNKDYLILLGFGNASIGNVKVSDIKILKNVDVKFDDGLHNGGKLTAMCYDQKLSEYVSYDQFIEDLNNKSSASNKYYYCSQVNYDLGIIK